MKALLKYVAECFGEFKVLSIDSEKEEIINSNLYYKNVIQIINQRGLPIILDKIGKMTNTKNAFSSQWKILSKGGFEKNTIYSQEESEELNEFKKTFDIENWNQLNGKLILDAGCGSGRLTSNVAQKAKDSTVIGIDISDGAVIARELAMKSTNHHVVQCDINYLPFRKELFNLIWSQELSIIPLILTKVLRNFLKLLVLMGRYIFSFIQIIYLGLIDLFEIFFGNLTCFQRDGSTYYVG